MDDPEQPRWVCANCGVLEIDDADATCPSCGEPPLDMRDDADEDFLYQLFKQRRASRWTRGLAIGCVVSAVVWGLIYYVLADAADLSSFSFVSRPGLLEQLVEGVAEFIEVLFLAGAALFGWAWVHVQKMRSAEPVQRAEQMVFGQHRSDTFRLVVTSPALLAVVLAVVGFAAIGGDHREIVRQFALDPELLRQGEELWRLLTSQILHGDVVHLLSNLVGLLFFGVIIDLRIGHLRTAGLMIGAGIAGGLVHGFLTPDPGTLVVGASGMVYGMLGANLVLMPRRKIALSIGSPFLVPTFVLVLVYGGLVLTFEALMADNVAWLAHLGGLVFGVVASVPFRNLPIPPVKKRLEQRRKDKHREMGLL